jgi:ribosomal protein S18 acetylase RimI-like enzyme
MIVVIPMNRSHTKQVALMHLNHLQTQFHGRAGRELLALYYRSLAEGDGACGYVAVLDNQVIGYVCGVWDAAQVKHQLMRRYGVQVAVWGLVQILTYPQLLLRMIRRSRSVGALAARDDLGYELRPMVVAPAERGNGLAAQLLKMLLVDAARRGYTFIHLVTEEDNGPANAFYRKNGFEFVSQMVVEGIGKNCYRRTTEDSSS